MTDVTGFGLLGHLVEMVKASNVDVTLMLAQVPLLVGLRETMAQGIFSSLHPQNVRLRRTIRNLATAAADPLYPVLFDPQTAGGLLASLPRERAKACVEALRGAGYPHAAIIGTVHTRSTAIEPITVALTDKEVDARLSPGRATRTARDAMEEESDAEQPVL
jgi:selenide,water dikinase